MTEKSVFSEIDNNSQNVGHVSHTSLTFPTKAGLLKKLNLSRKCQQQFHVRSNIDVGYCIR